MSHRRGSRGGRRRRGANDQQEPAVGASADRTASAVAPTGGTSKLTLAFVLFVGLFFGRVVSNLLGGDVLFLVDLVIYGGIAATVALAFRRSARRAVERRQRERLRRQRGRPHGEPGNRDGA